MGTTAAVIGGAAILGSAALGYAGSKEQADTVEKAAKSTENWQNYLIALEQRKYDEARGFRDLAYQEAAEKITVMQRQFRWLEADLLRQPESAREYYALASKRGARDIMQSLAPYGLSPQSSTASRAVGEMQEGLSAQEARDLINLKQMQISNRLQLAGMGGASGAAQTGAALSGQAGQLLGYGTQVQGQLADLYGTQGAITGGYYGGMSNLLSQMPLLYMMSQKGKTGGGG